MARPAPVLRDPDAPEVDPDAPIALRYLAPGDAEELTRAIEHSYGDTYDCRWVYDPAEVRRRLDAGVLRSLVAIAQDRVVGHVALARRNPDDRVGEAGQAVVDPAFRGHHLYETLKRRLAADAAARGELGIYSEATAAHPYSQKANLALGASETGFLLGYIPASVRYRAMETASDAPRLSVALFYLSTNEDPPQVLHPPPWHGAITAAIAEHAGLARSIATVAPPPLRPSTRLAVEVRADHAEAFVRVEQLGADVVDVLTEAARELDATCDCTYLDLRLGDPDTAALPRALHDELGYFFGGIVPNLDDGDVLRLQRLHGVDADPSDVTVASEHGTALLDYVFRRKVGAGR